jgi:hypothetical protein
VVNTNLNKLIDAMEVDGASLEDIGRALKAAIRVEKATAPSAAPTVEPGFQLESIKAGMSREDSAEAIKAIKKALG